MDRGGDLAGPRGHPRARRALPAAGGGGEDGREPRPALRRPADPRAGRRGAGRGVPRLRAGGAATARQGRRPRGGRPRRPGPLVAADLHLPWPAVPGRRRRAGAQAGPPHPHLARHLRPSRAGPHRAAGRRLDPVARLRASRAGDGHARARPGGRPAGRPRPRGDHLRLQPRGPGGRARRRAPLGRVGPSGRRDTLCVKLTPQKRPFRSACGRRRAWPGCRGRRLASSAR